MQRELFRKDIARQVITGIFYINGKRVRKKLASLKEAGYGPDGNPLKAGKREEERIDKWCWAKWNEKNEMLVLQDNFRREKAERIWLLFTSRSIDTIS